MLRKTLLLVFFSLLFITEAYTQTYFYGTVGIGKTEIKKFETGDVHFGMSFNPGLFKQYELGMIHEFPKGFSLKLGGGLANYSCIVSSPRDIQLSKPDYRDTHVDFYYISVPVGIRYNPILSLKMELGLVNNFFNSLSQEGTNYTFQGIKEYDNFKKFTSVPYWGFNYTFFDRLELGFTDHIYMSNFATYTNWYEQTNGIEPSVFFKYNTWNVYVSYKIRLSKRDD